MFVQQERYWLSYAPDPGKIFENMLNNTKYLGPMDYAEEQ